jgi:Fe(3+) dicitrate transport protein
MLIFLMASTMVSGQTGSIEGWVKSADKGDGLAGVLVFLDKGSFSTITNPEGFFHLENVPQGSHTLVSRILGFEEWKTTVDIEQQSSLTVYPLLNESILKLEEIEISANSLTRGELEKEQIGSGTYISPKELASHQYTDVHRTLRSVPGVNIQEEDGFGLRPNIGFRGTGTERSSKITLLEDGIPISPAPYSAPAAYYFPVMGRMYAMEVLKGSSQIKYGPQTNGGVLNMISSPIPSSFGGKIYMGAGSFGTKELLANVGTTKNNIGFLLETFQGYSNGFKELDGGGNTGFYKGDYMGKIKWDIPSKGITKNQIYVKAGFTKEESNETYLGLTNEDFENNSIRRYSGSEKDVMKNEHWNFSLGHNLLLGKNFSLNTQIYRTDFKRNWYKLDKVKDSLGNAERINEILLDPDSFQNQLYYIKGGNSPAGAFQIKANNRSYYAQGIQFNGLWKIQQNSLTHNLEFGARFHYDQMDRFQWVDEQTMTDGILSLAKAGIPGTESNRIESATAMAFYLRDQIQFKNLKIAPGLRYESFLIAREDYGKNDPERKGSNLKTRANKTDVLLPGIGFHWNISESKAFYGGVHRGFGPPGSNPETNPELSWNYELGFSLTKSVFNFQGTAFLNQYTNLLGADLEASGGTGSQELFNGGKARTYGLEMTSSLYLLKSKKGLSIPWKFNYTFTNASFLNEFESDYAAWGRVNSGDELPYLSEHQFFSEISLELPKISFFLSAKYNSEMRSIAGQGEIPIGESIPSNLIFDAGLQWNIRNQISVFGQVNNLTDKTYLVSRRPAGLRPGLPRAMKFGVKAQF